MCVRVCLNVTGCAIIQSKFKYICTSINKVQQRKRFVPNITKQHKVLINFISTKKAKLTNLLMVCTTFIDCLFCSGYFPIQKVPSPYLIVSIGIEYQNSHTNFTTFRKVNGKFPTFKNEK